MSRRSFASLLMAVSLPTALSLAGCADEEGPPPPPVPAKQVRFASLTEAQRRAVIGAALGDTAQRGTDALYFIEAFAGASQGCVQRQQDDVRVDYSASSCVDTTGLEFGGAAVAINSRVTGEFRFLDDPRTQDPSHLGFTGFRAKFPGQSELRLDGTIDQSVAIPTGDYDVRANLTAAQDGAGVTVRYDYQCGANGCQGSGAGTLVDAGNFTIVADGIDATSGHGTLELHGADILTLDLADAIPGQTCWSYRIGGAHAGEFCAQDVANVPVPAQTRLATPAAIAKGMFASFDCGGRFSTWRLDLTDNFGANRDGLAALDPDTIIATLALPGEGNSIQRPLHPSGHSVGNTGFSNFYSAYLGAGTDTTFTCDDLPAAGVRFDAQLADGQSICIVKGNLDALGNIDGCAR